MPKPSRRPAPRRLIVKLRKLIGPGHGRQTAWARDHGVSMSHVNNVLHARRPITGRLAEILAKVN